MGYYSDVGIVMTSDTWSEFINLCKHDEKFKKAEVYNFVMNSAITKFRAGSYLFVFLQTKWYEDGFDEIKLIHDFMIEKCNSKENQSEGGNTYVIIGENDDDVQSYGWDEIYNLRVRRELSYNE